LHSRSFEPYQESFHSLSAPTTVAAGPGASAPSSPSTIRDATTTSDGAQRRTASSYSSNPGAREPAPSGMEERCRCVPAGRRERDGTTRQRTPACRGGRSHPSKTRQRRECEMEKEGLRVWGPRGPRTKNCKGVRPAPEGISPGGAAVPASRRRRAAWQWQSPFLLPQP
jgi:hypothetical protein